MSAALCALFFCHSFAAEFTSLDINCAKEGKTEELAGGYVNVEGSGADIWNTSDGFRFVYKQLSGDFEIKARVQTMTQPDAWSKAGVMLRQSTNAGSIHAFMCATGSNGFAFQRRTAHGGISETTSGGATAFPDEWVKLVRLGQTVTAYKASDAAGAVFVQVGEPLVLNTTDPVLVGLAVTAHKDGDLCKAEFRNVSVVNIVAPLLGTGAGLLGQYFNTNNLLGTLAPDYNNPVVRRVDAEVNFDWGNGSPDATLNADDFSARWLGEVQAQWDEDYVFYVTSDDGVRVWFDGNPVAVVDRWTDHAPEEFSFTTRLIRGKKYGIKMEYYERGGGAVAKLFWSSPSTPKQPIPASQLYADGGLSVNLPAWSLVSPSFIEGLAWESTAGVPPAVVARASSPATESAATFISPNNFFADVPLDASLPTNVSVTNSSTGAAVSGAISWAATDLANTDFSSTLLIRKNDSLKLTSTKTPGALVIRITDGANQLVQTYTGTSGQTFPHLFSAAGVFIAEATLNGSSAGKATITVVGVDLRGPCACEIGYTRGRNVQIAPMAQAPNVSFVTADPVALSVSVQEPTANGVRLQVKSLKRGTPIILARLASATGHIFTTQTVDEYTLTSGLADGFLYHVDEDGFGHGNFSLQMEPKVPDLEITIEFFAGSMTIQGQSILIFSSNDLDAEGRWNREFNLAPGDDKTCHRFHVIQQE